MKWFKKNKEDEKELDELYDNLYSQRVYFFEDIDGYLKYENKKKIEKRNKIIDNLIKK